MTTKSAPWSLPLPQWLLIQATTGLTTAFTPFDSIFRPAAVIITVALACSVQYAANAPGTDTRVGGPLAAMGWVNVLNSIDLLVLSRVSYKEQIEWERKTRSGGQSKLQAKPNPVNLLIRKLAWSLGIGFNYRRIGTPWQISNLPHFDKNDEKYVPSRATFLARRGLEVLIGALLLHLFTIETTHDGLADVMPAISDTKQILLPSTAISLRSFLVQVSFTLSFAILMRSTITTVYNIGAIISVGLGISAPASWPPVSGPLLEACSLQKFWRSAWHQSLRKPLVSSTDNFIYSILRLARGKLPACYVRLLLVFSMSGIVHALMDLGMSVPLYKTGALWFFVIQVPAIIAEMTFRRLNLIQTGNERWNKVLGLVWVASYLFWSAPIWFNPVIWRLYETGIRVPSPFLFVGGHSFLE